MNLDWKIVRPSPAANTPTWRDFPEVAKRSKSFKVTISATEPPPNWEEQTLKVLTREMGFIFGSNAKVEVEP